MTLKIYSFLVLMLLCMAISQSHAQNSMIIKFSDNSESGTSLSLISKITFADNNLVLKLNTGTTSNYLLSSINKLIFSTTSEIINPDTDAEIALFPNPANDFICLKNLSDDNNQITIYNTSGILVMAATVNATDKIDISTLSKGVYIIRVAGTAIKFSKL